MKKEATEYMEIVIVAIFSDSRILQKNIKEYQYVYLAFCIADFTEVFSLELTDDLIKWTAILIEQMSKTFIRTFSTLLWMWISEADQTNVIHLRLG